MTNRELIALLTKCKDAPELGGSVGFGHTEKAWARLAGELGFEAKLERPRYSFKDYLDFFTHQLSHVWMRPVSVGLSVFALIFGGWVATVNASFDAVPGDVLYPVKLATERMQITLATSGQQRARLHTEFAGRRLDELNAITSSDVAGKDVRVKAAVDAFREEIASVNAELMEIQTNDPGAAAALAVIVESKTDAFQAAINQSEPSLSDENKEGAAAALNEVAETNSQAINAIVTSHEATQSQETEETLQKNFQDTLKELQTRIALSLGRLTVIENALKAKEIDDRSFAERIAEARLAVNSHEAEVEKAMDVLAAGGYRKAFDLLAEIEVQVAHSEEIITELEIKLTTGL